MLFFIFYLVVFKGYYFQIVFEPNKRLKNKQLVSCKFPTWFINIFFTFHYRGTYYEQIKYL